MSDATFTFRVDESLKTDFVKTAKACDHSGAQLLREFMRNFVRQQLVAVGHDTWFREQVQQGLDSADAGNLVASEDIEEEAVAWRSEMQQKVADITQ